MALLEGWMSVYVERAERARGAGWRTELDYHHATGRHVAPWRRKLMLRAARVVAARDLAVALDEAAERADRVVGGVITAGLRGESHRAGVERARRVHDRIVPFTVNPRGPIGARRDDSTSEPV